MRAKLLPFVAAGAATLTLIWSRAQRVHKGVVVSLIRYAKLRWRLARAERIIVITDFDRTVTTHACGISCHGVLEGCSELGAEYRAATLALKQKYLPVETSPDLTIEEKLPMMQDWYRESHTLLAGEPLTAEVLDRAARASAVVLRPGFITLRLTLERLGVPLVVCSAGLGNVVRSLLAAKLPPLASAAVERLPIVSNWLRFGGADGHVIGFSEPLLHMYNKDGAFLRAALGEKWPTLGAGRTVALVLGDGLGDATMADGLGMDHVVRIGYLNEAEGPRLEAHLPQYRKRFDAVVLHDGSFEFVTGLLRAERERPRARRM